MPSQFIARVFDRLRYRLEFIASAVKWRIMGLNLGRGSILYGNVVLYDASKVRIGERCAIGSFTVVMGSGGVTIGDDVLISSHCSIYSVTHATDALELGLPYRSTRRMAAVAIGNNVWIGTGVRILPGVTIGDGSIVGAGSVVTKSLPPRIVAVGAPARIIRQLGKGTLETARVG